MIRLFVALALPAALKAQLAGLAGGIPGAKWVTPENYHLTLRFIGEVQPWQAQEVDEALDWMTALGLDVRGLMAIPPIPERPEDSRPYFAALREIRDRVVSTHPSVVELSMGMTDDFEVAISEGASIIRVGRAIFGPRRPTGE